MIKIKDVPIKPTVKDALIKSSLKQTNQKIMSIKHASNITVRIEVGK